MKRFIYSTLSALLLCCAPATTFTITPASGPSNGPASGRSANGTFQFTLEDGVSRTVEFNARVQNNGNTTGDMTFSASPGVADPESPAAAVYVKASFDCLIVHGNQAVMSGVVTDSNVGDFISHRVILVVEDGGEGINAANRDKLTWGVYQTPEHSWVAQDAEVPDDQGSLLNWIATDYEREDDLGIPSRRSETIGCDSFSLSSYSLVEVKHGQGNIQVKP